MTGFLNMLHFGTPLALYGLLALPVIWWLLRFTPPRPRRVAFPPLRILLSLPQQEETPDRTPLWLLLLRLALAAVLIGAVAQPFLQPRASGAIPAGNRLFIVDDGWAAAGNWTSQREQLLSLLDEARRDGASTTIIGTAPAARTADTSPMAARDSADAARLWKPSPLGTDRMALLERLKAAPPANTAAVVWLADGLDAGSAQPFAEGLRAVFPSAVFSVQAPAAPRLPIALSAFKVEGSDIKVSALRPRTASATATLDVKATNGRTLLSVPVEFGGATERPLTITLPTALRNEVQSLALNGQAHAGARQLFDDRWRKRTVALMAGDDTRQAQLLLSPLHYVQRGLEPYAELYTPQSDEELTVLIESGLSMLVLADVGALEPAQVQRLADWVDKGGVLVRFAGPRLDASHDDLLPVTLREGDRTLGSALSWDEPQGLQPFPENSPFAGLPEDATVKVKRQVLAEPDATLADRTWASLADGTPLVTAQKRGKGLVVLFHVTANADWSNLPLSGLFLNMLQRVAGLDPAAAATTQNAAPDTAFVPRLLMTGEGDLAAGEGQAKPIAAADMDKVAPSPDHPPGLYVRQGREQALNLSLAPKDLEAMPATVGGVAVQTAAEAPRRDLAPLLFMLAALLFLADTLAAILLGGGFRRAAATAAIALALLAPAPPPQAWAQTADAPIPQADIDAALEARLAYVKTGDADIDATSEQGLKGLTLIMIDRTSAALAAPAALDIEQDDILFYPLIYWPVDENAQPLSDAARAKVVAYMKSGGTIFFDTRDGGVDLGSGAGETPLKRLLSRLDVPPLEPIPDDHVLTRSFYLLQDFPGRYEGPRPWVEATSGTGTDDPDTSDGVSSIIIGSNDYAAAWAINEMGEGQYAMVPGSDRQREFALRTGVNLVMYALTGNYKADQVHIPALLERLGQ